MVEAVKRVQQRVLRGCHARPEFRLHFAAVRCSRVVQRGYAAAVMIALAEQGVAWTATPGTCG